MKTTALRTWTAVGLSFLTAIAASATPEETPTTTKPQTTYTGTVTSLDEKERVIEVNSILWKKKFNLGDLCAFTLAGKAGGTLGDLHPGQQVTISYQNAHGVLVADRIDQQPMRHEGMVKAIDPAKHMITVSHNGLVKKFQIAGDCRVVLRGAKSGTLADVQPGHHVAVTYESPNSTATAREIAQTSVTFTGTLSAIDLSDRTVKAKSMFGTRKFNLTKDCAIVVQNRTDAKMRDLKPGDKLVFSYDEVNGINVANRIAAVETAKDAQTAQSTK